MSKSVLKQMLWRISEKEIISFKVACVQHLTSLFEVLVVGCTVKILPFNVYELCQYST